MILVDAAVGSRELRGPILSQGVSCDISPLKWGDACFSGNGPDGEMMVGIERKKIHDLLQCIDDGRYNNQRIGMNMMYQVSVLYLEGLWKCKEDGTLMEGFRDYESERKLKQVSDKSTREVIAWTDLKMGPRRVMYYTLYRYLRSVAHAGVIIVLTRDMAHTVVNIVNDYHYYQKKWSDHKSMRQVHMPTIATLTRRPPLRKLWAHACEGVSTVYGEQATKYFPTAIRLANSDETDWVRVGVDVKTAQNIVKEIRGW